jgi:hypothetical protein
VNVSNDVDLCQELSRWSLVVTAVAAAAFVGPWIAGRRLQAAAAEA